jgi:hypothetical protein
MIDQHMMQRMEAFRKVIAERDAQMAKLSAAHVERLAEIDSLTSGLDNKVSELDGSVKELLRSIAEHEEGVASCNEGFAVAKVKLLAQFDEAVAELVNLRDAELDRLSVAVAVDRNSVVDLDARLTATRKVLKAETVRRATTVAEHEEQLRKLRGGKYGEAKKLLTELEARVAKRESAALTPEGSEPATTVQTGSPIVCQNCQKIAKPWVLSASGLALCLDCATGKTVETRG